MIAAAVALYGFLLLPFVASATPVDPLLHAGICAPGETAGGEQPPPFAPVHVCCTAAQALDHAADAPKVASAAIVWPRRAISTVGYDRAEPAPPDPYPPTHARSPRGPPSV